MLYVFGGLPGSGKSTLSSAFAEAVSAFYLRIDTIEQAIRDSTGEFLGPEGYMVAYGVARDNLTQGASVVADSVNPIPVTRNAWLEVARDASSSILQIEIMCSNPQEHRTRIETRTATVPGLKLPDWEEVEEHMYQPWDTADIVIDTAGASIEDSLKELREKVAHLRPLPG